MLTTEQLNAIADESHSNRHRDSDLADMWRQHSHRLIAHCLDSLELIEGLGDIVAKYRDEPRISESDVVIDAPIGLMMFTIETPRNQEINRAGV